MNTDADMICDICGEEQELELVEHPLHGSICEDCQDDLPVEGSV